MLDKIKTQELKKFEADVKEYCSRHKSMGNQLKQPQERQVGVARFLSEIKQSTKNKLMKEKMRVKSEYNYQ
jgi:hypothetical protein